MYQPVPQFVQKFAPGSTTFPPQFEQNIST